MKLYSISTEYDDIIEEIVFVNLEIVLTTKTNTFKTLYANWGKIYSTFGVNCNIRNKYYEAL